MPHTKQNQDLKEAIVSILEHIPSSERISDHLTPLIVETATSNSDMLADVANHYLTVVHHLSSVHPDVLEGSPKEAITHVDKVVTNAFDSVRQQIIPSDDFHNAVQEEAQRKLNARSANN